MVLDSCKHNITVSAGIEFLQQIPTQKAEDLKTVNRHTSKIVIFESAEILGFKDSKTDVSNNMISYTK